MHFKLVLSKNKWCRCGNRRETCSAALLAVPIVLRTGYFINSSQRQVWKQDWGVGFISRIPWGIVFDIFYVYYAPCLSHVQGDKANTYSAVKNDLPINTEKCSDHQKQYTEWNSRSQSSKQTHPNTLILPFWLQLIEFTLKRDSNRISVRKNKTKKN